MAKGPPDDGHQATPQNQNPRAVAGDGQKDQGAVEQQVR